MDGAEGIHGFLKYHRQLLPPQLLQKTGLQTQQLPPAEPALAGYLRRPVRQQLENRHSQRGFPGTGLADNPQGVALLKFKGDVPHRLHTAVFVPICYAEILYLQHSLHYFPLLSKAYLGLSTWLRPSPSR